MGGGGAVSAPGYTPAGARGGPKRAAAARAARLADERGEDARAARALNALLREAAAAEDRKLAPRAMDVTSSPYATAPQQAPSHAPRQPAAGRVRVEVREEWP